MLARADLVAFALALTLLCACSSGNGDAADDAAPPSDVTLDRADASVDAPDTRWADPPAPSCAAATTGHGNVWLDDPADMSLVERALPCLAGDGRLHGAYIEAITPLGWQPAVESNDRFFYSSDDAHFNEVQSYWALSGMLGRLQAIAHLGAVAPVTVQLELSSQLATSRYSGVDRKVVVGLASAAPAIVPIQLLDHEYAHHLILGDGAKIDQIINEALADYLAADFTGRPLILSLSRVDLPDAVRDDPALVAIAARYFERSVDNALTYPADVVSKGEACQLFDQAAQLLPQGSPLVPQNKLDQCAQMSAADKAKPEPHLTGRILSGALWQLRRALGAEAVDQLVFAALEDAKATALTFLQFGGALVAADQARQGGVHVSTITQVLSARGLMQ